MKKQEEKEEAKRIREEQKEAQKLQREIEEARKTNEKERSHYKNAMMTREEKYLKLECIDGVNGTQKKKPIV